MDDLISRQDAINAVENCEPGEELFMIKSLPSVQPEREKGEWIYEKDVIIHGYCSCCGFQAIYQETDVFGYDFCPQCGADMKGDRDE